MRILPFLLSAAAVVSSVWADTGAEKYNYQVGSIGRWGEYI